MWVGIGLVWVVGSFWDFSLGRSMGLSFSWGHGVFHSFISFLCYWGLRSSKPRGYLHFPILLPLPFFFVGIGTFLNIEHDLALLHMSTYIAERWHSAHGLVCAGMVRPHL